jgi:hypothetical protein
VYVVLVSAMISTSLQGGFARVYEVKDAKDVRHAIKVISKDALKTTKNRTKASIAILHRNCHPHHCSTATAIRRNQDP